MLITGYQVKYNPCSLTFKLKELKTAIAVLIVSTSNKYKYFHSFNF